MKTTILSALVAVSLFVSAAAALAQDDLSRDEKTHQIISSSIDLGMEVFEVMLDGEMSSEDLEWSKKTFEKFLNERLAVFLLDQYSKLSDEQIDIIYQLQTDPEIQEIQKQSSLYMLNPETMYDLTIFMISEYDARNSNQSW